ncbi:MAG: tRNA (N6-isopentenyl adenosine(37)-C2)-methylthiotransferase MiaB [Candidatus Binatia bacterium]|nr:tRNA (N6-isopentenyl adenosine(37)-C2)-methylthiotransferase MiaB [Candidatus Binatia bacterium]
MVPLYGEPASVNGFEVTVHETETNSGMLERGASRRVYIETYGCQMNLADTELLLGQFRHHGYEPVRDPAEADVILLNTCAIREHAEERVVGRLGDLYRFKARRPHTQLGIVGCMAQHVRDRLLARLPFVDFVVGPDGYRRLPEVLRANASDPYIDVRLDRTETYADLQPEREAGVRAWVTIMRGCDKFCTFCIVPFVRGRERSLPAGLVLQQVEQLAAQGFREVVYLGQTVNAYHDGTVDFATLLRRTNEIPDILRIRFTSPHPADMREAAVAAIAECDKVCPQVHLPVQSGSDAVLARMARGYTVEQYLRLVEQLRAARADMALSTDIIVGFPGETERDFEATLELLREVRFDQAFMFQYSARSGTKAAKWPETVPAEEKQRRLRAVIELQESIARERNRAWIGRTVEVLVEGPARKKPEWFAGKTPQFKTCIFPAWTPPQPGTLVDVRVCDANSHTLFGELSSPPRRIG